MDSASGETALFCLVTLQIQRPFFGRIQVFCLVSPDFFSPKLPGTKGLRPWDGLELRPKGPMPCPDRTFDFICPGAAKSGTTWLYSVLSEHPEICLSSLLKESNLFLDRDVDEVEKLFPKYFRNCRPGQRIGEICPKYWIDGAALDRIQGHSPEAKMILMLRDPIERAYSHYCMFYRSGAAGDRIGDELAPGSIFIEESRYSRIVPDYERRFSPERVLVLDFNLVREAPERLFRQVCDFLEVSAAEVGDLERQVNERIGRFKCPKLMRALYECVWWSRRHLPFSHHVFNGIARFGGRRFVRAMATADTAFPELGPELCERLKREFAPDYEFLRQRFGRG